MTIFRRRSPPGEPVVAAEVTVADPHGLNPRVARELSSIATRWRARIALSRGAASAEATDVGGMLMLGARHGDVVAVRCTGVDASEALGAIVAAFERATKG